MISRKLIALTAIGGLSFSLTACGDSADTTATVESSTATSTVSTEATTTQTTTGTQSQAAPADSDIDPVFKAIDAVLAEYPGGIISDIDREDSTDVFEIDVVAGQEVHELDVNAGTGEVRVTERENNDGEDIREANDATITAAEAITRALADHRDGVLDEISLNEEDGLLEWDIDLDDANRNDLVELTFPAR